VIDDAFFLRWQRQILWCANTWLGRLYLTSNWDRTQKRMAWRWMDAPRFDLIMPSGFTVFVGFTRDGHPRYISKCYTANHFAQKVAQVLFWLPYTQVERGAQGWGVRPTFAYATVALLAAFVGSPSLMGTVSTFNPVAAQVRPMDCALGIVWAGTWSSTRNAASGDGVDHAAANDLARAGTSNISRLAFLFDTGSVIGALATILSTSNTKFSVRTGTQVDNTDGTSVTIVQSRPASDSTATTADYAQFSPVPVTATVAMTEGIAAGDRFALSGYVNDTTVVFPLNAIGRSWIARNGETLPAGAPSADLTRLGMVITHDALDDSSLTGDNAGRFIMADNGSNKPELSVEWVGAAGFPFPHFRVGDGMSSAEQRWKA
jgi:hypothetical protein